LKVLYVTSNGGIHDYRFLKKLVEDYEVLLLHYASRELIDDIRELKNLKIISKKPLIRSFPLLTELLHFRKVYKKFRPDIVHTGYAWQVGILASMLNVPHHLSMPWGSDILFQPEKNFLFRRIVKKVMKQCDHIHCDAEYVKYKIKQDYNIEDKKISVFPRGIDLKLFTPLDKNTCRKQLEIEQKKFAVIFNRYFEAVYGINSLLEGYRIFASDKEDVLLLLLSSGSLKSMVLRFIEDNGLTSKVKFVGKIPNTRMPVYLGASDIYISTSKTDGSSLSLLEAMATGLGVIVTDVPAIKEWVSEANGIMVQRNSPNSISGALEEYYKDRQLAQIHGKRSIAITKEKADWDKNYLKLKEIYAGIIGSAPSPAQGERSERMKMQ
jgi:glycosyltransferase involved in cell wall biosynthesis